uniref:Uncharacterized protein n=1 Tax=Panagrolaimus superbus TaxID=310955 RepID=A0A914YV98_9BILA
MFPFRNGKAVPFQVAQAQKFLPLLKKSDARWEDLGWAWGKRSNDEYFLPQNSEIEGESEGAAAEKISEAEAEALKNSRQLINERQTRSMKQVKKNPDWHDLGWAWGKK